MSFSVPGRGRAGDTRRAREHADGARPVTVEENHDLGKVSLIGAGMRSHPGVAAKMFRTLADNGINLQMISTSPIKISCMIARSRDPERRPRAARGVRARARADRGVARGSWGRLSRGSPPNHATRWTISAPATEALITAAIGIAVVRRRARARSTRVQPLRAAARGARPDGGRAPADDVQLPPPRDRRDRRAIAIWSVLSLYDAPSAGRQGAARLERRAGALRRPRAQHAALESRLGSARRLHAAAAARRPGHGRRSRPGSSRRSR